MNGSERFSLHVKNAEKHWTQTNGSERFMNYVNFCGLPRWTVQNGSFFLLRPSIFDKIIKNEMIQPRVKKPLSLHVNFHHLPLVQVGHCKARPPSAIALTSKDGRWYDSLRSIPHLVWSSAPREASASWQRHPPFSGGLGPGTDTGENGCPPWAYMGHVKIYVTHWTVLNRSFEVRSGQRLPKNMSEGMSETMSERWLASPGLGWSRYSRRWELGAKIPASEQWHRTWLPQYGRWTKTHEHEHDAWCSCGLNAKASHIVQRLPVDALTGMSLQRSASAALGGLRWEGHCERRGGSTSPSHWGFRSSSTWNHAPSTCIRSSKLLELQHLEAVGDEVFPEAMGQLKTRSQGSLALAGPQVLLQHPPSEGSPRESGGGIGY